MNKKIIMIAGFWLCLLAPNLLYPFMKNESDTGTDENRALADFPHLSLQTLESYPGEMDSYINDHAAFRNRFLSLNARLNLDLFDYPDSTEVLKGKDGWYFYTAGSSLADCLGINRYPEPVLQAITAHIQTAADYFESQGIQFILVLTQQGVGLQGISPGQLQAACLPYPVGGTDFLYQNAQYGDRHRSRPLFCRKPGLPVVFQDRHPLERCRRLRDKPDAYRSSGRSTCPNRGCDGILPSFRRR